MLVADTHRKWWKNKRKQSGPRISPFFMQTMLSTFAIHFVALLLETHNDSQPRQRKNWGSSSLYKYIATTIISSCLPMPAVVRGAWVRRRQFFFFCRIHFCCYARDREHTALRHPLTSAATPNHPTRIHWQFCRTEHLRCMCRINCYIISYGTAKDVLVTPSVHRW